MDQHFYKISCGFLNLNQRNRHCNSKNHCSSSSSVACRRVDCFSSRIYCRHFWYNPIALKNPSCPKVPPFPLHSGKWKVLPWRPSFGSYFFVILTKENQPVCAIQYFMIICDVSELQYVRRQRTYVYLEYRSLYQSWELQEWLSVNYGAADMSYLLQFEQDLFYRLSSDPAGHTMHVTWFLHTKTKTKKL